MYLCRPASQIANSRIRCWTVKKKTSTPVIPTGVPSIPTYRSPKLHSQRWLSRRSVVTGHFVTPGSWLSNALPTFFHFLALGVTPGQKFIKIGDDPAATHPDLPSCQFSSPCVNPRRRYPLWKILWINKQRNSKQYIPNIPIGMWG